MLWINSKIFRPCVSPGGPLWESMSKTPNLSTIDIWSQIILCCRGLSCALSEVPNFYSPEASSNLSPAPELWPPKMSSGERWAKLPTSFHTLQLGITDLDKGISSFSSWQILVLPFKGHYIFCSRWQNPDFTELSCLTQSTYHINKVAIESSPHLFDQECFHIIRKNRWSWKRGNSVSSPQESYLKEFFNDCPPSFTK